MWGPCRENVPSVKVNMAENLPTDRIQGLSFKPATPWHVAPPLPKPGCTTTNKLRRPKRIPEPIRARWSSTHEQDPLPRRRTYLPIYIHRTPHKSCMAIASNSATTATATPPVPRADRHRQHAPPVWRRAVQRRGSPPCQHRRGVTTAIAIAIAIAVAAVPPPLSGVRRRRGDGGVLPYPGRAALGNSCAELPPVGPLPFLQPAADHALQLPHAAAQRFQLSFVPRLGFL